METPKTNVRSLRISVGVSITIGVAVLILVLITLLVVTTGGMAMTIEDEGVYGRIALMDNMMARQLYNTRLIASDIALREGTAAFVKGEYPSYLEDTWPDSTPLEIFDFSLIAFADSDGNFLYSARRDYKTKAEGVPSEELLNLLRKTAEEMERQTGTYAGNTAPYLYQEGFFPYNNVVYQVCAISIQSEEAPYRYYGTVFLGEAFTGERLLEETGLSEGVFSFEWTDAQSGKEPYNVEKSFSSIVTSFPVPCLSGSDARIVLTEPRTAFQGAIWMIATVTVLMLLLLLLAFLALFRMVLQKCILPLESLSSEVEQLYTGDIVDPEKYTQSTEIYSLSRSIDHMISRLRQSDISLDVLGRILNGVDVCISVTSPETGRILFINDAMKQSFYLTDNVIGTPCWEVFQPGATERCSFCPVYELENSPQSNLTSETRNKESGRYYLDTHSLVRWEGGKTVHMQCMVDITEQKQNEQTLRKQLAQQEFMIRMTDSLIVPKDTRSLIENVLEMTGCFMGLSRIVLLSVGGEEGDSMFPRFIWRSTKCPDDVPDPFGFRIPHKNTLTTYLLGNKNECAAIDDMETKLNYEVLAADGILSLMAAPVYVDNTFWGILRFDECAQKRHWCDSDKLLIRLVSNSISNLIARQNTEEDLYLMSAVVDRAWGYITYISADGAFQYINPGTSALSGYTSGEIQAGGMGLLFGEETARHIAEEILPAAAREGVAEAELILICKTGGHRILQTSFFPANENCTAFGAIGMDITAARQLESALVDAKEQAERSNRAKTAFLSRMSHEMRTPMNAIIGMTAIGKLSNDPVQQAHSLDKIEEASNHLLNVINDILDMSKIEAEKLEFSPVPFNFERLVQSIESVIRFRLEEKHQTLEIELDEKIPSCLVADSQRISQVLTNLLSNAVKFTPDSGRIVLTAVLEEDEAETCLICISVKDNGIGVSEEQQKSLFEPFEQADNSISRRYGGTGLGLSISKQIVEMMGGNIWIESAPGQGSTFSFTIRCTKSEDVLPLPQEQDGHSYASAQSLAGKLAGRCILLAEDVEINREILLALTAETGVSADCAEDGAEALRMFQENPGRYQLVLMDIHMPQMDGYQASRAIRELSCPEAQSVPIVALTANVFKEDVQKCLDAGMNGHLGKPIEIKALFGVLEHYLL